MLWYFSSLRHYLESGRQSRRWVDLWHDGEWAVRGAGWDTDNHPQQVITHYWSTIQEMLSTLCTRPTTMLTPCPPRRITTTASSLTRSPSPGPSCGLPPPRRGWWGRADAGVNSHVIISRCTWCAASASTAPPATRSWPSLWATPAECNVPQEKESPFQQVSASDVLALNRVQKVPFVTHFENCSINCFLSLLNCLFHHCNLMKFRSFFSLIKCSSMQLLLNGS